MRTWLAFSAVILLSTPVISAAAELRRFEYEQVEMGVPFRIALYARDEATANKAAAAAYARIGELNRIMSDYNHESELLRLCKASGPGRPVKVSPELFYVLCKALELSERSGGAFDVTVGPVVQLWRRARRLRELPDPKRLADARERVGFENMRLDKKARTVELLKEKMRLDLGGIAKGYAGDEALRVLKQHGITRGMIDGSGDIVVGDPPPGQCGWKIAIEQPPRSSPAAQSSRAAVSNEGRTASSQAEPVRRFLLLANAAVATSGDAYQYVEIDGVRYSHIVDPHTGLGLTVPSSVTVVAPNGTAADSLASAVSVLGPERGLALIEVTAGAAALVVQFVGNDVSSAESPRFCCFHFPNE